MLAALLSKLKKKPHVSHDVALLANQQRHLFVCREHQSILEGALEQGVTMPYSCQVGSCGQCKCRIISGKSTTMNSLDYMFNDKQLSNGYTLACQTYARSPITIELDGPDRVAAKVVSITQIDAVIYEVLLLADDSYQANIGQYIAVENIHGTERQYSIVSVGRTADGILMSLHVQLKAGGAMSEWWRQLFNEKTLPMISVGPAQGSYSPAPDHHIVAIAGGSGLGVTAALIDKHLATYPLASACLVAVFSTSKSPYSEIVCTALNEKYSERFNYTLCSRHKHRSADNLETLFESVRTNYNNTCGLICGSSGLVEKSLCLLRRAGFAEEIISFDEFV